MSKTILISGSTKGFGRAWTEAFLEKGYKVAATARNIESLNDLKAKYGDAILPLTLDVNNREDSFAVVRKVQEHFGTIDILINNAGYALNGAVEEASEKEARAQFETNFFGTLWLTQAVLPTMRNQKSGHIIQVSSILGITTLPNLGLYNATKFAVEGLTETLAQEVKQFGINVTLVEPNGYVTDIWGNGFNSESIPAYEGIRKAIAEGHDPDTFGKTNATVPAIVKLVEAENPPLRLFLGKVALPFAKQTYEQKIATWEEWADVSVAAHG
ncbi:NADP-dependent 3-hydroxy acid dehydrogenase YdfG [Flavobacterium sp. 90]|uniref:SDR family NAD(P)-dependent oxidoreductase n=1 Tax=unclassified Flavobacterium TaxID=196869 RepID=UPI000EAE4430|nr:MULTISPECIES: SDR family NAD(P)-dependent oxidoreductase [unclassified Flavobacterium]RKR04816.1 NADP-dependent 3-hydroxy acid dehydrogenase YdfG [Flavobacterium sp. 81]TCK56137.1 NADP-dependent 3-hydroxy acid dehydrogenase YdfG [Flavobacterium sp. 90]